MADVKKYLQAARQALQEENYEDAKKYYDMVKTEDPTNAEAKIQYQYCKFRDCKKGEAYNFYSDFMSVVTHAVDNISASDMPTQEQLEFLSTLFDNSIDALSICRKCMSDIAIQGDNTFTKSSGLYTAHILFAKNFGDAVAKKYATNSEGMQLACKAWKSFVNRINGCTFFSKTDPVLETIPAYVEKIQKVDPSFTFVPKKRGCF